MEGYLMSDAGDELCFAVVECMLKLLEGYHEVMGRVLYILPGRGFR